MTVRVLLYLRRRFSRGSADGTEEGRGAQENKKFSLPLLAFPLMWLVVFVILVTVASVQGSRDPVTKTVEVGMACILLEGRMHVSNEVFFLWSAFVMRKK